MMARSLAAALAALVALAAGAEPVHAQALGVPVAVDARVDAAFPLGDFSDVAGNGLGFSIGASVGIAPNFGIYGKYSQTRFGGGWFGDDASDATDAGFAVGVAATLPGTTGVSPWIGGGLLFHQLEVRGTRSGVSQDMGFELGGGLAIPLTAQLRFTPSLNYRHYGATIPAIAPLTARDLTVQYLTLGLGLNYSF
jgi:hypothetical protein